MQLNKPQKLFFVVTFVTTSFILLLGSWWLYLTFKLSNELEALGLKTSHGNILNMVKWEGAVFFILIISITLAQLYMYISDRKKSQSINLFFASLTHELKTPLASIKLQAQVLLDIVNDVSLTTEDREKIEKYAQRLHDSSFKLEHELDKHLQLSRVERDGVLNYKELELKSTIKYIAKDFPDIALELDSTKDTYILADEFALHLILRNLFDNSLKHNKSNEKSIKITITNTSKNVTITFKDNAGPFTGDIKKLGSLFYKHNSPKGSGLGLYMIKKLVAKMGGKLTFSNIDSLVIKMEFKKYA